MKVKAWAAGGSLVVTLPADICRLLGVIDGTDMELDLEKDMLGKLITIRKVSLFTSEQKEE